MAKAGTAPLKPHSVFLTFCFHVPYPRPRGPIEATTGSRSALVLVDSYPRPRGPIEALLWRYCCCCLSNSIGCSGWRGITIPVGFFFVSTLRPVLERPVPDQTVHSVIRLPSASLF